MADILAQAIADTSVHMRWREPYVTDAVAEIATALPAGCYRGFWIDEMAVPSTGVRLRATGPGGTAAGVSSDSFLLHGDTANGYGLAVRESADVVLDLTALFPIPAGAVWWIWADVTYASNVATTANYRVSDADPRAAHPDADVIGVIKVGAGAGTIRITTAVINTMVSYAARTLPQATKREVIADYVAGDRPLGLLSGEDRYVLPTLDEKHAMDSAPTPATAANPFATVAETGAIGTALANHLADPIAAHADTAISAAAISGDPAFAGTSVRDAETQIFNYLRDRSKWRFWDVSPAPGSSPLPTDGDNPIFSGAPSVKTLQGGTVSAAASKQHVAAQLLGGPYRGWGHPFDPYNTRSLGDYQIWDMTLLYMATGERRLVVLANAAAPVSGASCYAIIVDPNYMLPLATVNIAATDDQLPITGGHIWGGVSICSDGTYFYVMFENELAAHRVQGYSIDGVRRASMTAGGVALPGVGVVPAGFTGTVHATCYGKIQVASVASTGLAAKLATANYWNTLAGDAISVVNCTTNAVVSGCGDAGSLAGVVPANCYPIGGLCTDGTNLYATFAEDGSVKGGMFSAQISNPANIVGSGKAGVPVGGAHDISQDIVCDGEYIWMPIADPSVHAISVLRLNASAAPMAWIVLDATGYDQMRFLAFDGVSVHIGNKDDIGGGGTNYTMATAVARVSSLPPHATTLPFANYVERVVWWNREDETAAYPPQDYKIGRMLFDGDGVWMIMNCQSGNATWSGVLRRLPRAGLL